MALPTREEAQTLLEKHVKDNYQLLHSKMVALAMEAYANKLGEDVELWYITGLIHDLDYFEHPKEHPDKSIEWFKEWGYPEELIEAVADHYVHHDNLKESIPKISAALIACDEMSGLIHAYSLMRPTGYEGMKAKSVKKKFKDKAFAAKINRDDVRYGMEKFEVEFSDHVELLVDTFKDSL